MKMWLIRTVLSLALVIPLVMVFSLFTSDELAVNIAIISVLSLSFLLVQNIGTMERPIGVAMDGGNVVVDCSAFRRDSRTISFPSKSVQSICAWVSAESVFRSELHFQGTDRSWFETNKFYKETWYRHLTINVYPLPR